MRKENGSRRSLLTEHQKVSKSNNLSFENRKLIHFQIKNTKTNIRISIEMHSLIIQVITMIKKRVLIHSQQLLKT